MKINTAKFLTGKVNLPGDKSISHRAAMLAAISVGDSVISNFSASADCASTLACLGKLGVLWTKNGNSVTIHGVGLRGLRAPEGKLDCGNSGTTMRLMSGLLAGAGIHCELTGDASLLSRPMKRIIEPLRLMGAEIDSNDGRAPLYLLGSRNADGLKAIEFQVPIASAQVKSCVLLAGLSTDGTTTVIENAVTRDHTERMLKHLGAGIAIETNGSSRKISIKGKSEIKGGEFNIPADISAAAFFIVAAACLPGSEILLPNVGINPTRSAVLDVLRRLGIEIRISDQREISGEPVADITIKGKEIGAHGVGSNLINGSEIPILIDELPILAILGTRLPNGLEVRDAAELRVKESDRISAVVENLRRMGAEVDEFPDGFYVRHSALKGAEVDSLTDHRIAMAFAIAGLIAEGTTEIKRAEAVDVSFPGFFDILESLTKR